MAWSDLPWVLEGAEVRISIVGFDAGSEAKRCLDGQPVDTIYSNLTAGFDASAAEILSENQGIGFIGVQPSGRFEVPQSLADEWMQLPLNVNGRPNSDVLRPFVVGADVLRRPEAHWFDDWIIDFGPHRSESDASLYEAPFQRILQAVRPERMKNNRPRTRDLWWIHGESRPGMRMALEGLSRFLISPIVARYRVFVWMPAGTLAGNKCVVFARQDDYFFGVLQSRAHEIWAIGMATRHGVGNDPAYHVSRCFETFPLPWSLGQEPWRDERLHAIAAAANRLNEQREAWLNPRDAAPDVLKKRTLTNLYNERPAWLAHAHAALDRAVWAAYGWEDAEPGETPEDAILARLLALNDKRSRRQ